MKAHSIWIVSLCSVLLLFNTDCQRKQKKQNPKLISIELLRGDITLCGGDQFGDVNFTFSCSDATKENFDLGLSLLHSFEYDEAEKAFVKVIDADPSCAMAYWGVAMSNFHPLWAPPGRSELEKGSQVLQIAESLPKTAKEEAYLNAIGAFYKDWDTIDHKTRAKRFEQKMYDIYQTYSEDNEATIFYALALNATADPSDKNYTNQKKAGALLETIFPDQPNHPGIAHYIIHNYDNPVLAPMALQTARRYADIAPASAHAQHMPSHIFTRLGLWDESIRSNINSSSSALCYSETIDPTAHWAQEIHAIDYLVYAYLQVGDNQAALGQNNYLHSFEKVFPIDFAVAYAAAAIPVRIALENKRWKDAANMQLPTFDFPWENFHWEKAILHFARALGAVHTGDIPAAENEIAALASLHQQLVEQGEGYKANQVNIQIHASKGWWQYALGNNKEAIALLQEAAEMEEKTEKHPVTPGEVLPARELLGDLYVALNMPSEALEAYQIDLEIHPNRFNGLYGAAVASLKLNEREKAKSYYEQLIILTQPFNTDRPEVKEAKTFVEMMDA